MFLYLLPPSQINRGTKLKKETMIIEDKAKNHKKNKQRKQLEERIVFCPHCKKSLLVSRMANDYEKQLEDKIIEQQTAYTNEIERLKEVIKFLDPEKTAFVYAILYSKENAIKIGVAKDVEQRFATIQGYIPGELKIINTSPELSETKAYKLESKIHEILKTSKIKGEWFKYSEKTKNLIKDMISNHG